MKLILKKRSDYKYHKLLIKILISRHSVSNPNFLHIENILKNYVNDYNKSFRFYLNKCKWELPLTNNIINVKSDRLHSIHCGWNLRKIFLSIIESFESHEHKFSHISEMSITFITDIRNMTYEHYLNQPKPMVEWIPN